MNALGLTEIADRTLLEPGGWSVVIVEEGRVDAITKELAQELTILLEEDEGRRIHVVSTRQSGSTTVDELARMTRDDIALVPVLADAVDSISQSLDYERARLVGGPAGVILISEDGLHVLIARAPSFWSWVGPRVWTLDPLVEIQSYLIKASDQRLVRESPAVVRKNLLAAVLRDGYFDIAVGTVRNFNRTKDLPHFTRRDGGWFDF